jgi:hypothetical protein
MRSWNSGIFALFSLTDKAMIQWRCGTYCRGGPPWPPSIGAQDSQNDGLGIANTIKPRAAMEGRPYSTSRSANLKMIWPANCSA